MFGGRVAEERIYGKDSVTTGAGNDIQQATSMARKMVTEWGMSDVLGPLRYEDNQEEIFLGHSVARSHTVSDATAKLIDEEIRGIIEAAEQKAHAVLEEHEDSLHAIAKALLEYETLSGEDVDAVLKGETLVRPSDTEPPTDGRRKSSVPTSGKAKPTPDIAPKPQPEA
jgi:cell division protease FtsH